MRMGEGDSYAVERFVRGYMVKGCETAVMRLFEMAEEESKAKGSQVTGQAERALRPSDNTVFFRHFGEAGAGAV